MGTWDDFVALSPVEQGERALVIMRDVVAEFGEDHCASRLCQYVDTERQSPDCLIGQIASRLGMPLETMASQGNTTGFFCVGWSSGLHDSTVRLLDDAQSVQDGVKGGLSTWGAALAMAERKWAEVYRKHAATLTVQ